VFGGGQLEIMNALGKHEQEIIYMLTSFLERIIPQFFFKKNGDHK